MRAVVVGRRRDGAQSAVGSVDRFLLWPSLQEQGSGSPYHAIPLRGFEGEPPSTRVADIKVSILDYQRAEYFVRPPDLRWDVALPLIDQGFQDDGNVFGDACHDSAERHHRVCGQRIVPACSVDLAEVHLC